MYSWLLIILGIIFLTLSISNPFYNLLIKKYIDLGFFFNFLSRIILFILLVWVLSNTPIIGNYINSVVQSGVMQLAILTGVIVKNQEESYV